MAAGGERDAYKKQHIGRCFRCLALDHRVAQCRDPIRCLSCRGVGHTSKYCPAHRRKPISTELRSRLAFPARSIHSRLIFPELRTNNQQQPRGDVHSHLTFPPIRQPPLQSTTTTTPQSPPPPPSQHPSTLRQPSPCTAEMERVPRLAAFRPALGRVNIVASDGMAAEAGRLLVHAVVITVQPGGYSPSTLEVAYALAIQLQVPRHSFGVTRLTSVSFVADFKFAPARDRAVFKGSISIKGSPLLIRPWSLAGGTDETTWWYHVKITMENVPLEAWNEEGVELILGNGYIFDRFDSRSAGADRETSQFLTCWV